MASAAILSLEEFRDTKRRVEIRQRLHDRFTHRQMARNQVKRTDAPWDKIGSLLPVLKASPHGARNLSRIAPASRVCSVASGLGLSGKTCQSVPSPSACWWRLWDGEEQGAWLKAWRAFWPNWTPKARSSVRKPSPMGALRPQKKWRLRREDYTRQGDEVDGGGRRPRCFTGKPPSPE